MAEEEPAEDVAGPPFHRDGEVATDRQMPGRHSEEGRAVSVSRILRDIVQTDRAFATKRRPEHGGGTR